MRLCLVSDIHLRFLAPQGRAEENFFEEVALAKFEQVLKIAEAHKVDAIIQAGDLLDTPDPSRYMLARIIRLLRQYPLPFYTILGQHDMYYRQLTNITRTGAYLLQAAGVLQIVGLDKTCIILPFEHKAQTVYLSGISFEQDYDPQPVKNGFNILVAHATVGDTPLFPGHALMSVRSFVKAHKGFNLILLGDIHYEYRDSFLGSHVFNTGVLIRKSIAEREQKPNVVIYNTLSGESERVGLTYSPWETAFTDSPKAIEGNARLEEFIDLIREDKKLAVSFDENLVKYYAQHPASDAVKKLIAFARERSGISGRELREVEHVR